MKNKNNRLFKILILMILISLLLSFVFINSFINPGYLTTDMDNEIIITERRGEHSDGSQYDFKTDDDQERPGIYSVSSEGKKEFETLPEAVEKSVEGSTIFIESGNFLLEEPLEISKSLKIIGSGAENTCILCESGEYVLYYEGDGPFSVSNISFHREGNNPGDVVVLKGGEVNLYRCAFYGGIWDEDKKIGGSGLIILGRTYGTIQECISENNELFGIDLFNNALPVLAGNIARFNGASGIGYSHNSIATAYQNQCIENGYHGIDIQGEASPTLTENICEKNYQSGIAYFNNSSGIAYHNECSSNKWGIYIDKGTNPILVDNILGANTTDIEDKR